MFGGGAPHQNSTISDRTEEKQNCMALSAHMLLFFVPEALDVRATPRHYRRGGFPPNAKRKRLGWPRCQAPKVRGRISAGVGAKLFPPLPGERDMAWMRLEDPGLEPSPQQLSRLGAYKATVKPLQLQRWKEPSAYRTTSEGGGIVRYLGS